METVTNRADPQEPQITTNPKSRHLLAALPPCQPKSPPGKPGGDKESKYRTRNEPGRPPRAPVNHQPEVSSLAGGPAAYQESMFWKSSM